MVSFESSRLILHISIAKNHFRIQILPAFLKFSFQTFETIRLRLTCKGRILQILFSITPRAKFICSPMSPKGRGGGNAPKKRTAYLRIRLDDLGRPKPGWIIYRGHPRIKLGKICSGEVNQNRPSETGDRYSRLPLNK